MRHLEIRQIPVENIVLTDLAEYVANAPFRKLRGSEVCTDLQLLGLKCMHVTAALGIPRGRVCDLYREAVNADPCVEETRRDATARVHENASLSGRCYRFNSSSDSGVGPRCSSNPRRSCSETIVVPLIHGTSVRVTEGIDIVVPPDVTVDLLCISGSRPNDP